MTAAARSDLISSNRLELCKKAGARNIAEYNEKFTSRRLNPMNGHRYLPYIVVVVDEFADLIMTAREVEGPVMRLAQKARAAGIPDHLLPFRRFPGNQPSTTLLLPELTPFTLGQLIALYEHKVFCLGVLWNLNSFDQWGVELGKQLAGRLVPCIRDDAATEALDASTRGLIAHLRQFRS